MAGTPAPVLLIILAGWDWNARQETLSTALALWEVSFWLQKVKWVCRPRDFPWSLVPNNIQVSVNSFHILLVLHAELAECWVSDVSMQYGPVTVLLVLFGSFLPFSSALPVFGEEHADNISAIQDDGLCALCLVSDSISSYSFCL